MPKMTIQEAAELGLLSPEELSAAGYNPFTPRAGASWTPQLGIKPGLSSSSFFRYPSLYQRPGISSLRFGLGGLGQGLTLSPESPALGLGGVAAPVGRPAARGVGYGVAGGVAGGRAAIGSEGSGNLPTMRLPDGRTLVRMPDGRTMIVGGNRPPIQADAPEGLAALQAMGLISTGLGAAKSAAALFDQVGRGVPGGEPGGIPGGEPGGAPAEDLLRPASLQIGGPQAPGRGIDPQVQAALEAYAQGGTAEPGTGPGRPEIPLESLPPSQRMALEEFASPGSTKFTMPQVGDLLRNAPDVSGLSEQLYGPTGSEVLRGAGVTPTDLLREWSGVNMSPEALQRYLPGGGGGDLSLSPAFYAPGGTGFNALDPETRRLYALGLTPEQVMGMMPAPSQTRADTAPRGLGPSPSDIFTGERPPAEPGANFTLGNTLGLGQSLLGVGKAGITGDPAELIGALVKSGMSINKIAEIPGLDKAAVNAGFGGLLGVLNLVRAARAGDIPGAIGGGLSTIGSLANFAASSPAFTGATGLSSGALGAVGVGAAGAGGLLSLAQGIQGLIKGGVSPVQSALTLAGGLTSTYSALSALSSMYPNLFGTTLPSMTSLLESGASALGVGGAAAGAAGGTLAAGASAAAAGGASAASVADAVMGGTVAAAGTGTGAISGALAAAAPWLAVAAPVIIGIVGTLSQNEARRIMREGYVNNPIAGNLYSNASSSMAAAAKDLAALGPLDKANTADLAMALTTGANNMKAYFATIQGPGGPVRAGDTLTGMYGREGTAGKGDFPTVAAWQKQADDMKAGLANIAKELMNRGLTYEQIGQLPVTGDWASQSEVDAGGTPDDIFAQLPPERRAQFAKEANALYGTFAGKSGPMSSLSGADYRTTPPQTVDQQVDALFGIALGSSMLAKDKDTHASGLYTAMYGGPLWAAMARMGVTDPEIKGLINQHFDPWVNLRTPEFIRDWTAPRLTEQDIANYDAAHGDGAAALAGLTVGAVAPGATGGRQLTEQDLANYEAAHGVPYAGKAGDWIAPTTPPTPPPAPNFWAGGQPLPGPVGAAADAAGSVAFDPLAFLSTLQKGERAAIQSGKDTLTFVPYKPEESSQFSAPESGYQQIGEGLYAKASPTGGAELYLPQDKTSELGKALAGYQGSPIAGQLSALLTQPVASGQEAGATPGAGPAGDIAPSAVPAGTAATAPTNTTGASTTPPDATAPVPGGGFKKGGVVPKTGEYLVHKGEVVIPADKADTEQESESFLDDMRQRGDLSLGGDRRKLEMPKMGPGPLERGEDPTMPDEAAAVGGIRQAHHEESETTQDRRGKWRNTYGRDTSIPGRPLPGDRGYDTVEDATVAAGKRSENSPPDAEDPLKMQRQQERSSQEAPVSAAPKEKGWYVHLKEGVPSQDLDGNDPMVRRLAFTPDEVEQSLDAGEAPIMVGKGVLNLPPSALRGMLQKAQDMQFKDPMKNPAVVAMANRFKKQQQPQGITPEGDTIPGSPAAVMARKPRFRGDRGPAADQPLDSMPARPPDFGGKEPENYRNMDVLPKVTPAMPEIPFAAPQNGLQVNGGAGIARAMRLAQGPQGPADDFARQDRMLQGIDRGTIAPSTLGGASREQRRNLTPEDIMRQPSSPGLLTPQPGLLERARRMVTG
jgi:hypothetical protein